MVVKEAIQWEEPEPPPKSQRYFPHLKKKSSIFPLMDEIKDVVLEEWKKVGKRPVPCNCFQKLYPLSDVYAQLFGAVPPVDVSVMRLARNMTLPLEDAVAFRDGLHHRINLKKTYQAAGGACKLAVALTSVSRAVRAWTKNVESALRQGVDTEQRANNQSLG